MRRHVFKDEFVRFEYFESRERAVKWRRRYRQGDFLLGGTVPCAFGKLAWRDGAFGYDLYKATVY